MEVWNVRLSITKLFQSGRCLFSSSSFMHPSTHSCLLECSQHESTIRKLSINRLFGKDSAKKFIITISYAKIIAFSSSIHINNARYISTESNIQISLAWGEMIVKNIYYKIKSSSNFLDNSLLLLIKIYIHTSVNASGNFNGAKQILSVDTRAKLTFQTVGPPPRQLSNGLW